MQRDHFLSAIDAIRAAKLRSLLTTLGVTIGVFAIILLMAVGEGARSYVGTTFASLGGNVLQVRPGRRDTQGAAPVLAAGVAHALSQEDERAIDQRIYTADGASGIVEGTATLRYDGRRRDVAIFGVGRRFLDVRNMKLRTGRFFAAEDERGHRRLAVIGHAVQRELFADTNPLGKPLRLNDSEFRVVGVLERKGNLLGTDLDELVLVPSASALDLFDLTSLSSIMVRPRAGVDPAHIKGQITTLLKRRHNNHEDFTIMSQDELLATVNRTMAVMTAVLVAIASIALVVGGIGIANIMLASVHERTREIGLRRAVGATRTAVWLQFLIESGTLSSIGGAVGVALGAVVIGVAAAARPDFPIHLSSAVVAMALGFSAVVGMLAGVVPALRAARLDPVEALRHE